MKYIKSRDTLTSRLGTGPSVNQETIAKIHTLLTAFDSFALQIVFSFCVTCDDEDAVDAVEHKQHFMVVNPNMLQGGFSVQRMRICM